MGDSHIRSNLLEETTGLKIKFTNASFTSLTADSMTVVATHVTTFTSNLVTATTAHVDNVTATSMVVKNASFTTAHITTAKSNALTATAITVPTLLTLSATPGFKANLVASAALSAGATTRMLRVTSAAATPMYVKVYIKS